MMTSWRRAIPVPSDGTVGSVPEDHGRTGNDTVSDETRNLADSLDEMLGPEQAEPPTEAGEPETADAPTTPATDEAPDGDAFADQVQQMLDEAAAPPAGTPETEDAVADDTPIDDEIDIDNIQPFDPAIDALADELEATDAATADEPVGTFDPADFEAPEEAEGEAGDDESQLINEIDAMLAASADHVVAREELDETEEAEPAPQAAADEPAQRTPTPAEHADAPDTEAATDEPLEIEGDMQSVEDLMNEDEPFDDPAAEAATAKPLEAERSFESKFDGDEHEFDASDFATAEDVANELDEIEGAMQSIDELDREDAVPAETPPAAAPVTPSEPAPQATEQGVDEQVLASSDKADRPSALIGVLAIINKPVMSKPALVRDTVGCIAIGTLLLAALCWVNGVFGPGAAMMLAVPLMSLLPVAIFFLLIKPHRAPAEPGEDGDGDVPDGAAAT